MLASTKSHVSPLKMVRGLQIFPSTSERQEKREWRMSVQSTCICQVKNRNEYRNNSTSWGTDKPWWICSPTSKMPCWTLASGLRCHGHLQAEKWEWQGWEFSCKMEAPGNSRFSKKVLLRVDSVGPHWPGVPVLGSRRPTPNDHRIR